MLGHAERPASEMSPVRPADIAGPGSRFCAVAIDTAISAAVLLVATATFAPRAWLSTATPTHATDLSPLPLLAVAAASFLYQGLSETFVNGRTLGKRVMGLRAISADGSALTRRRAVVRNALRPVDFLPLGYGVGGLLACIGPCSQRLGDLVAKTIVVRERRRAPDLGYFSIPPPAHAPPLADGTVELTANERAMLVSFLERRASLTPAARARVGGQLATRLYRRHGGAWTAPESYLERLIVGRHRD